MILTTVFTVAAQGLDDGLRNGYRGGDEIGQEVTQLAFTWFNLWQTSLSLPKGCFPNIYDISHWNAER